MNDTDTTAAPEGGAASSSADAQTTDGEGYWQAEARKAFEQRDVAKAKTREYETAQKESSKLEAHRLAEAGEFKASYEAASKRLAELEPIAERYAAVQERLTAQVVSAIEALPEDLRELVPSSLSETEQLDYIDKLRTRLGTTQQTGPKTPPASPPSASNNSSVPPYGTPEFLEWQRTAPLAEVTAARSEQRRVSWPWSK